MKINESNVKTMLKQASIVGASALMLLSVGAGMQGASAQHVAHADGVPSAEALLAEADKNGGESEDLKQSNAGEIASGKAHGLIFNSLGNVVGYKGVKQLEAEGLKEGYEVPTPRRHRTRRAKRYMARYMKRTARKRRANKRNAARKALRADQKLMSTRRGRAFMKLYKRSLRRHMRKSTRRALIRQLSRRANRKYVNSYKALRKARLLK